MSDSTALASRLAAAPLPPDAGLGISSTARAVSAPLAAPRAWRQALRLGRRGAPARADRQCCMAIAGPAGGGRRRRSPGGGAPRARTLSGGERGARARADGLNVRAWGDLGGGAGARGRHSLAPLVPARGAALAASPHAWRPPTPPPHSIDIGRPPSNVARRPQARLHAHRSPLSSPSMKGAANGVERLPCTTCAQPAKLQCPRWWATAADAARRCAQPSPCRLPPTLLLRHTLPPRPAWS